MKFVSTWLNKLPLFIAIYCAAPIITFSVFTLREYYFHPSVNAAAGEMQKRVIPARYIFDPKFQNEVTFSQGDFKEQLSTHADLPLEYRVVRRIDLDINKVKRTLYYIIIKEGPYSYRQLEDTAIRIIKNTPGRHAIVMHFAANQAELDNGMLSFTFEWAPYGKWTKANKALVDGIEKNHLSFKAYR